MRGGGGGSAPPLGSRGLQHRDEDVVWLEVTVDDAVLVQVVQPAGHIPVGR